MRYHVIKPHEIREARDLLFEEHWQDAEIGTESIPDDFMVMFRKVAENAFQKGFYYGICRGCEEGARLVSAEIASDIADIFEQP